MKHHSELNTPDGWAVAFAPDGRGWATSDGAKVHFWSLAEGRPVRDFAGASAPIRALAFAPDGQTMAAGSTDGSVTLWDTADNKKFRAIFKPSTRTISTLAFSPDGKTIALGGLDRAVHLIDASSGEVRLTLRGPRKAITGLAFSPDGKTIASTSDGEPTLFVWDSADGRPLSNPTLLDASAQESVACLAFAPDGRTLFAGGDRGLTSFDMTTGHRPPAHVASASKPGQERATLRGHADTVRSLAFLEGGSRLVSRSEDGVVKVWDLAENRERFSRGGGDVKVRAMALSPDGKTLAVGLRPPARSRPAPTNPSPLEPPPPAQLPGGPGLRIEPVPPPAPGLPGSAPAPPIVPLPAPGQPGQLSVPLPPSLPPPELPGPATAPTVLPPPIPGQPGQAPAPAPIPLPPGQRLDPRPALEPPPAPAQDVPAPAEAPTSKPHDEVKLWNLDNGEERGTIASGATAGGRDLVVALAYSRDGKILATGSRAGVVKLWDAVTLLGARADLAKREGGVDVILFSPDGKTLVGANAAGQVTLWDVETGQIRASFTHDGGMNQIIFSPDGKLLATGGGQLPTAASSRPRPASGLGGGFMFQETPGASEAHPESLAFSGGDVRLWDLATGERLAVLPMSSGKVARIAFSPDGKTLAASTDGPLVTLWDVAGAAPIVSLAWPSGMARYLAFSPDGKLLATGGDDETLRVWELPAGTLRADLAGHADAIDWLAFSPDGKTLATASKDATVKLWAVPPATNRP